MTQKRKTIAYLVSYRSIFNLGPWRNSILLMSEKLGYEIIIYQFKDKKVDKNDPITKHTLIQVPYPLVCTLFMFTIKSFFRFFKKIGFKRFSTFGDSIDYFIKSYYYIFYALFQRKLRYADTLVVGDPPSMVAAKYLSYFNKKKIIFWQLELLLEKELADSARKYFKKLEIKESKNIACGIEFGEMRIEILRRENKIPYSIPILLIPNAPISKPEIKRNYYFNDYFGIPYEKKIILVAGSVSNDFNDKMRHFWESIKDWPDNWIYIIHSNIKLYFYKNPQIPKYLLNKKIFIHDKPLPFSQVNLIYSSCDIGFIPSRISEKINNNLYYSELSLGKLFNFTQNGIPVISRNLYNYTNLIERNGIGYTFNDSNEIFSLIKRIIQNEDHFRNNCIEFSIMYNFRLYHDKLIYYIYNVKSA